MENKNVLSVMISSFFMAGSVHAAISNPTPLVVGHKPTLSFQGTKPVAIQLGDSIVINEADFLFADTDGDIEAARSYIWKLDGVATANSTTTFDILITESDLVGKRLTLEVIPKTVSGDPNIGDVLVVDYGLVGFNASAAPSISNLVMTGSLQLGQVINATYVFESNGGDNRDQSTYQWGPLGSTAAGVSSGMTVTNSQVVDGYLLTIGDVGSVLELTVEAKMAWVLLVIRSPLIAKHSLAAEVAVKLLTQQQQILKLILSALQMMRVFMASVLMDVLLLVLVK